MNIIRLSDYQSVDQASLPTMMRRLADEIEAGQVSATSVFAFTVSDDDQIDFYGWGEDRKPVEWAGLLSWMQQSWFNIAAPSPDDE